ncbi:MAG: hypothetical protein N3B14_07325, partial [Thermoleophilia bacterium]|nr:hypothetical protein [Thermoleophilia bacterium]
RLQETGVGGQAGAHLASCLHAHAAAWLAVQNGWLKGEEPVPDKLAQELEGLWRLFLPPLEECWCQDRRCKKWDKE